VRQAKNCGARDRAGAQHRPAAPQFRERNEYQGREDQYQQAGGGDHGLACRAGAFKGIELSMQLGENLPDVYADPAQIGQVVLNLALNAIHAITPPGKLEVSTRTGTNLSRSYSRTRDRASPRNIWARSSILFYDQERNKGYGLGLAVSYGIIKKHGGDIAVASILARERHLP